MLKQTIQTALKQKQMTQKELAQYLNIGADYLSNLLNGRFKFTNEMLFEICMILDIPKEQLGLYNLEELIKENDRLKDEIKELKTVIKHLTNVIED